MLHRVLKLTFEQLNIKVIVDGIFSICIRYQAEESRYRAVLHKECYRLSGCRDAADVSALAMESLFVNDILLHFVNINTGHSEERLKPNCNMAAISSSIERTLISYSFNMDMTPHTNVIA